MSVYGKEHDVQSHMFRPTITDMLDEYCGDRYDISRIQSRYTKVVAFGRRHKRGVAAAGRATFTIVCVAIVFESNTCYSAVLTSAPRVPSSKIACTYDVKPLTIVCTMSTHKHFDILSRT